jgi:hypothetical protein
MNLNKLSVLQAEAFHREHCNHIVSELTDYRLGGIFDHRQSETRDRELQDEIRRFFHYFPSLWGNNTTRTTSAGTNRAASVLAHILDLL